MQINKISNNSFGARFDKSFIKAMQAVAKEVYTSESDRAKNAFDKNINKMRTLCQTGVLKIKEKWVGSEVPIIGIQKTAGDWTQYPDHPTIWLQERREVVVLERHGKDTIVLKYKPTSKHCARIIKKNLMAIEKKDKEEIKFLKTPEGQAVKERILRVLG